MGYVIWRIKDVAEICRSWQDNEFDGLIVFDGKRGLGKSTGAIKLARAIRKGQFKIKKDIAFTREDVMDKLANNKNKITLADEMINVTYNRDFFSEQQKMLIKMLNMYRDSCNILIACVPNFYDLDKQFRNLVKMRINVVRRGVAVIHTPNQSSYTTDIWDMTINEKIERKWLAKGIFKPQYSRLTTFRGMLVYNALTPKQERIYKEVKEKKRNDVYLASKENQETKTKRKYFDIYTKWKNGDVLDEDLKVYCNVSGLSMSSLKNNFKNYAVADKEDWDKLKANAQPEYVKIQKKFKDMKAPVI